jgi:undecaprenyl diphosphate synthase
MQTLKIRVKGRVQAVFYRDGVKKIADQNKIVGKVENLKDGTVEIIASGSSENLKTLLDWCYEGSVFSKVESLSYEFLKEDSVSDLNLKHNPVGDFAKSKSLSEFKIEKHNKNYFLDKLIALKSFLARYYKKYQSALSFKNKKLEISEEIKLENTPNHLVIIPDGNRRWAKENKMQIWNGHKVGADNLKELIEFSFKNKVKYITAWGFSTENWKRDNTEVEMLMNLFLDFIKENKDFFLENKISFHHFGRKDRLSKELLKEINNLELITKDFTEYNFAVALDYGGRDEISRAINESKKMGDESNFEKYMDTIKFPEVDLVIRTGGEKRVSGMMPWQSIYAEYYFSNLYFPDFKIKDLYEAFLDYSNRKRRFGK